MAAAFDAKTATYTVVSGFNTLTINNLTVGAGSNRALAVLLAFTQTAVPTFTKVEWDTGGSPQAMTAITGTGGGTGASSISTVAYGLIAPTSGNKILTVTWSGAALTAYGVAISFTGVDQTSTAVAFPHGTGTWNGSAIAGPASVTITSATGNMTAAGFCNNSAAFTATNNTQLAPDPITASFDVISNYASGAATVTHTGTFSGTDPWISFGFDVLAASGAADVLASQIWL